MRKNNSDKSKKHNGVAVKTPRTRKSTPSKNRNGATKMPENGSADRKTSPKSSTWMEEVKKKPEMERELIRALHLNDAGRPDEAIRMLEKLNVEYPDQAPILWYLGGVYWDLAKAKRAIPYFQRATQLAPRSEKASLGLFHALWDTNQLDEALEEIKRFQLLTNWSCKDYLKIMAEIKKKWLEDSPVRSKASKKK